MTKRQIALVCAIAGLTMVEGFLTINAIAEGFYNCNTDPSHSETCLGQVTANFAVLIGPWLVAGSFMWSNGGSIAKRPFALHLGAGDQRPQGETRCPAPRGPSVRSLPSR